MSVIATNFRMDEFKTFFRVSRTSVEHLERWIVSVCMEEGITGITDRDGTGGTPQTPLYERLLVLMWYMAILDKYAAIADRFGIAESTACTCIHNLIEFIEDLLLSKLITWPTNAEMEDISNLYMELKNFNAVVGMIDGTHITIEDHP